MEEWRIVSRFFAAAVYASSSGGFPVGVEVLKHPMK
jgi:hypothetical protein